MTISLLSQPHSDSGWPHCLRLVFPASRPRTCHGLDYLQAEAPIQGPVAGHNRWDTAEFTTDADKDKFHRLMVRW